MGSASWNLQWPFRHLAVPLAQLAGSDGSSDGACGCEKVPRVDAMTKLSLALKQENALGCVCRALPSAWPKLRKTSKLYMWRLDELKLHALQQALIEELNLVFADLFELCERGDAECVWILLSQGMKLCSYIGSCGKLKDEVHQ